MAWSYKRRIKVIPGIHLNLSRSGISTSIGVKGASLTLGKNGVYLNTSVPGLGLYNRQKIVSPERRTDNNSLDATPVRDESEVNGNIFSLEPEFIQSQTMEGVKQAILASHEQRSILKNDKSSVQKSLAKSKRSLTLSYVFLYGLLNRASTKRLKSNIQNQKDTIDQIDSAIESSVASLDIEFDEELRAFYEGLTGSFNQLCESWKIWDVTSSHFQDRVRTRSAASTLISKKVVRFSHKPIDDIRANITPIYFNNANGADLYFYPNFLIVYSSKRKFAILGLDEIRVEFSPVRFVETDLVPRDSKVIDRTWVKVNKNGTPDRRFKDNREIPIVQYGSIALKSPNGLNEEYMFSNFESAEDFCRRFLEYQKVLAQLNK